MNSRSGGQSQQLRSMNINSSYATQPASRQTPRLQNSQKTGLGNGNAGAQWAFGAPSSAGGFGGLGGAPGLGQPRQFAQVMGGGGQGPFDMSDFPTLSGGRPQANSALAGGWNSNVIRQPTLPQQNPSSQQQRAPSAAPSHQSDQFESQRAQQPAGDRGAGGEDFPPLGGQLNGDPARTNNGFGGNLASAEDTLSQTMALPIRGSPSFQQNSQTGASAPQVPTPAQTPSGQGNQSSQSATPASGVKRWADMTEQERLGMSGLEAQLEAYHQLQKGGQVDDTLPIGVRNVALVMGQDLNNLGMDLDSPDPFYPTFTPFPDLNGGGPLFDSRSRQPIPAFTLPQAYTVTNVPPVESRMSAFSDETLFNIFYQNPRDIQQEMAAAELSARDWRWHKVLHQWLQKDSREANSNLSLPVVDHTSGNVPIGVVPVRTGERTERGVYIFFDANNWRRERREFVLDYDQLDHRVNPAVMANGGGGGGGGNPAAFGTAPGIPGTMTGSGAVAGGGQPGLPQGVGGVGGPSERQNSVHSGGA